SVVGALVAHHVREIVELDRSRTGVISELRQIVAELPVAARDLADTEVRAPADGFILTPNPERLAGKRFAAGETMLEVADPADLELVLEVDERDIARVTPGQEVHVNLDAFPFYLYHRFAGTVREVGR